MLASELKEIPFLARVPEPDLQPWAVVAESVAVLRRHTFFTPAERAPGLYLLKQGLVLLGLHSRRGETRMTALIGPEQCFNIQCLHPAAIAAEFAHALTDAEVVLVPADAAREAVRRGGALAALLAAFAAGRLAETTDDLVRSTTLDVRARTAVALLRLSDRLASPSIPLTHEQLSGMVGARRETLAVVLAGLRGERIVATRYRLIRILDRDRLYEIAQDGYPTCAGAAVPVPLTGDSCLEPET